MPYQAHILSVLIASPGDVKTERDAITKELVEWNRQHQHSRDRIRLEARRWELDAVPELGSDVQSVINQQLVDDVDIVIAVFHSRLGTPTSRAASGTAEEIDRTAKAGKPVHVYFSTKPVPRDHDAEQLRLVRDFQKELNARGYAGTFPSVADLRRQIRLAITKDVDEFKGQRRAKRGRSSPSKPPATPEAAATLSPGQLRSATKASKKAGAEKPSQSKSADRLAPRIGPLLEISVSADITVGSSGGLGPGLTRQVRVRNLGDEEARNVFVAAWKMYSNVNELDSDPQQKSVNIPPGREGTLRAQWISIPTQVYVGWIEHLELVYARCYISETDVFYTASRM
jgi:hypothetical protein